ncbi:hypothetical protein FIE12Z_4386 [Fusarium flagelliforme]|uniref:Uncharacterized protein n=1 Tax=Fusarium flagelliforme TaxID=2675880 RepID=A0A395MU00_9HYPO|nr:hypothetical protein FIE12Z_4386 [Fusarium flagelliforme]
MHFARILASLALISHTSAFRVPAGTTDGFYKVYLNAQGEEIHERVSDVKDHATSRAPAIAEAKVPGETALDKRQNGERYYSTHCGCGIELNHTNCDDAVQDLKNQMYDILWYLPAETAFYSIRDDVVAFSCNITPDSWYAQSAEFVTEILGWVTNECGWYIAGTGSFFTRQGGFFSTTYIGYMVWRNGVDFCHDSIRSDRSQC